MSPRRGRRPSALVVGLLVLAAAGAARADERVDITATDGVQLIGDLAGTTGAGVVLVPDEHTTRETWRAAGEAIAARGFRTLRFDLRGHGDSSGSIDLAAADRDVEGAFRYLLGRKIRPVFLVGVGHGATAALLVGTRVPAAGVITLSLPPDSAAVLRAIAEPGHAVPVRSADDWKTGDARGPAIFVEPSALDALARFLTDPKAPAR